jgi:hypothetical protein
MLLDHAPLGGPSPAKIWTAGRSLVVILRILAFAVLVFLPGAWVTFGMFGAGLPFWARLCGGAVLSPLVVCLQFYLLRLLGLPFDTTAALLPLLNLPALYLILRQRRLILLPSSRTMAAWLLVLLVPLAGFVRDLADPQTRSFAGHAWLYSDPIYRMANGELLLTEPELVGFRLGYPWPGLVYQGVLSYLLNSPPAVSYIWTNLVWLLIIFCLLAGVVAQLGGNRFSRVSSVIWLCFGVNFVGFVGLHIVHAVIDLLGVSFVNSLSPFLAKVVANLGRLFGEERYTPWLIKFLFFEQEPLALGLFTAILYVLLRQQADRSNRQLLVLLTLMMAGLGLQYAPLYPAAVGLIGAQAVAICFDAYRGRERLPWKHLLALGAILLISGALTAAYVSFLNADRMTGAVFLSPGWMWRWKPIASVIVTSPLLLGLGFILRRTRHRLAKSTILLALGGLSSLATYVVFHIPGFTNEYKYFFTAAICLTPFAPLALEPYVDRIGRRAYPAFGLAALILAFPMGYCVLDDWPWFEPERYRPSVDIHSFELRLSGEERLAPVCEAIRGSTPADSIVVIWESEVHLPTLTGRQFYAPPHQQLPHTGVNILTADILVNSRGIDRQAIEERQLVQDDLFQSADRLRMADALERILQFRRPVAIVAETDSSAALLDWLASEGRGWPVYSGGGFVIWLIEVERPPS